jgi:hypothetical protein
VSKSRRDIARALFLFVFCLSKERDRAWYPRFSLYLVWKLTCGGREITKIDMFVVVFFPPFFSSTKNLLEKKRSNIGTSSPEIKTGGSKGAIKSKKDWYMLPNAHSQQYNEK